MIQPASLISGLINLIRFSNDVSYVRLLDADGAILLNLRIEVPQGMIFINDQVDHVWRERRSIALPEVDAEDFLLLEVQMGEEHLQLQNSVDNLDFIRFTGATADRVRYCVFKNAFDENGTVISPVLRPEEMAAEVASRISTGRVNLLEEKLDRFMAAQTAKG